MGLFSKGGFASDNFFSDISNNLEEKSEDIQSKWENGTISNALIKGGLALGGVAIGGPIGGAIGGLAGAAMTDDWGSFGDKNDPRQDTINKANDGGFESGFYESWQREQNEKKSENRSAPLGRVERENLPKIQSDASQNKNSAEEEIKQSTPDISYNPSRGPNFDATGVISYTNDSATRNRNITENLSNNLSDAVSAIYGPGYKAQIYSGGQSRKGSGGNRVGSTRHDDHGHGGRAADVYIVDPEGNRINGDGLAPLAQYWLANGYGSVGMEMNGGGIHLDEITQDQLSDGQALSWDYGELTSAQSSAIENGLQGKMPELFQPVKPSSKPRDDVDSQTNNLMSFNMNSRRQNDLLEENEISPAMLASSGELDRPDEEKEKISFTLAGELGPQQIQKLKEGDPKARAELANMIATIENRANSTRYSSINEVLVPETYNSLGIGLENTEEIWEQNGDIISSAVEDFYSGKNKPNAPYATHYANYDIVNPSWDAYADDKKKVGDHIFSRARLKGSDRYEYTPSQSFIDTFL